MPIPATNRPRTEFKPELFYFWRHDPGTGALSQQEWKLQFEAHITSLNDTSSPQWSEYYDMGRPDPKVMYESTSRNITVGFIVVALNKEEHENNHEVLLARLGRMTYPIFKSGLGYNGPHVLFQIGKLIKGYGVITNLSYDWQPDYPWVENRPLYTDVNLTIRMLANTRGQRPDAGKPYFITND